MATKPRVRLPKISTAGAAALAKRWYRRPFKGILLEPIHAPHDILIIELFFDNPELKPLVLASAAEIIAEEQDRRFAALAAHFQMPTPTTTDEWKHLCLALAKVSVPGFKTGYGLLKPTRGFTAKQFSVGGYQLLEAVDKRTKETDETQKQAVTYLYNHVSPWCQSKSIRSLEVQYSKAKAARQGRATQQDRSYANMRARLQKKLVELQARDRK